MRISFEIATKKTIPILLGLMKSFYAVFDYPFDKAKTQQCLSNFFQNPHYGRFWLIKSDGNAVGYIVLTFGYSFEYRGQDAFIDEFFIQESHRGKGIGSKTMQFVLSEVKKEHIKVVHLEVENSNNAKQFYIKRGFHNKNRELLTHCFYK